MTAARMGKGAVKKLTPWFDARQVPARVGVYETRTAGHPESCGYQYWAGRFWSTFSANVYHAFNDRDSESFYQDNEWRGLASDPSKGGAA